MQHCMLYVIVCRVQIAMPRRVRSLSYNHLEGYIACGGDEGVLKAVKLDAKIGSYFFNNIGFFININCNINCMFVIYLIS